jgi:hypothetical protein
MSALAPKADIRQQSSNGTPGAKKFARLCARAIPFENFFVKFCSQNFYEMLDPFRGDRIVGYVRSWPLADIWRSLNEPRSNRYDALSAGRAWPTDWCGRFKMRQVTALCDSLIP